MPRRKRVQGEERSDDEGDWGVGGAVWVGGTESVIASNALARDGALPMPRSVIPSDALCSIRRTIDGDAGGTEASLVSIGPLGNGSGRDSSQPRLEANEGGCGVCVEGTARRKPAPRPERRRKPRLDPKPKLSLKLKLELELKLKPQPKTPQPQPNLRTRTEQAEGTKRALKCRRTHEALRTTGVPRAFRRAQPCRPSRRGT